MIGPLDSASHCEACRVLFSKRPDPLLSIVLGFVGGFAFGGFACGTPNAIAQFLFGLGVLTGVVFLAVRLHLAYARYFKAWLLTHDTPELEHK